MGEPVLIVLQLAMVLAIPALIGFFTPRRARLWAILCWTAAPLLVLVLMAAGTFVTGKAGPGDVEKLVFGVLLIGSFLALPWLIACAVGYGVGALMRRRLRPEPPRERREPTNLFGGTGLVAGPIVELPHALESLSRRGPARPADMPEIVQRQASLRTVLIAVLIATGALALIALATVMTLKLRGEPPPQALDVIPPMPPKVVNPEFPPMPDGRP